MVERRLVALAAIGAATLVNTPATAAPRWDEGWSRVTILEASVTGGLAIGAYVGALAADGGAPRWVGPILFDRSVRNAARVASPSSQEAITAVSDGLLYGMLAAPFATAAVMWAVHDDRDAALQWAWIDAQALLFTDATISLSKNLLRRERPDASAAGCELRPLDPDCAKSVTKASFPSRHAGLSFAAASLLCSAHLRTPVAGTPADAFVCASALTVATAVSVMRVIADRHYATDIVAGAFIGAAYGWLLPALLHFHRRAPKVVIAPTPLPSGLGIAAVTTL